jgi:hypothetical protein
VRFLASKAPGAPALGLTERWSALRKRAKSLPARLKFSLGVQRAKFEVKATFAGEFYRQGMLCIEMGKAGIQDLACSQAHCDGICRAWQDRCREQEGQKERVHKQDGQAD